jgi:hypothetical protein
MVMLSNGLLLRPMVLTVNFICCELVGQFLQLDGVGLGGVGEAVVEFFYLGDDTGKTRKLCGRL